MFSTESLSKLFIIVIFLLTALFVGNGLSQESYPNRPITMIIAWGPGMYDTQVRDFCRIAEKKLGQPIVVENKPGASGVIGTNYFIKSKPDGYTLGDLQTSMFTLKPYTMDLPFDPWNDITVICGVFQHINGYAVRSDAPWKTHEEIIAYSKKNPGKFKYGVTGVATFMNLPMAWIAMKEGVKWQTVIFKSGGEVTMALLGGHVDAISVGAFDIVPQINAGKMRLILALNDFRWPGFPDIPNMAEKGYGFYVFSFGLAIGGPKGIPEPIRQKLENVFKEVTEEPSFVKMMKENYVTPKFMTGKEFTELHRSKVGETREFLKTLGLLKK